MFVGTQIAIHIGKTHLKGRLLGKGLLQRLASRDTNGYQDSSLRCRCGNAMRFVAHRRRDIHTLFGWIRIKRAYYHCQACGLSVCPYDHASGLGVEPLSPALAKACCLLAIDDSFQQFVLDFSYPIWYKI